MFFENIGAMQAQLKSICREGKVTEVFPERHSCKVTFEDRDNLVSAELPILTLTAGQNKSYRLPDIDERVVVLMTSNDEQGKAGYIIGSLYTGDNLPSVNNENIFSLKFADDAEYSYKRATQQDKNSVFNIKMADGATISYECGENKFEFRFKFSDGCQISYNERAEFEMKFADKSTITHARGDLDIDIKGEINISAKGDIALRGANIHLN